MPLTSSPENIDVVILCGGMGTRLKNIVSDRPKVMALVNGQPFLDTLMDYVAGFKFRRFILCVGYMKDFIKKYYIQRSGVQKILFSEEEDSLGTAGAIKNAGPLIQNSPFLVMNGDSFCKIDIKAFLDFHINKKALASIALVSPDKDVDYGVVIVDANARVMSFNEKAKPDINGFINAGMYFFNRDILGFIPRGVKYSLEYDLFPDIINKGVYGYVTRERLIDIGTPERFQKAEGFFEREKIK